MGIFLGLLFALASSFYFLNTSIEKQILKIEENNKLLKLLCKKTGATEKEIKKALE